VDDKVVEFLNQALQQRIQHTIEELISISRKRTEDVPDPCLSFAITSDTKNALREIEKRERDIAKRKSAEEKQRLLEAAKANKKDKRDNKVLQDKLNKVVLEEEAKRTNDTALQAIGNIREKKTHRRQVSMRSNASRMSPAPPSSANFPGGNTTSLGASVPVFKITYRDALIFVERDVDLRMSSSALAEKCYFGEDMLKYTKDS